MKNCQNLYYLSTIACQLSECLSEEDIARLSADLVVLSDMLANILAHRVVSPSLTSNLQQPQKGSCDTPFSTDWSE